MSKWPDRRILDLFGIALPIIQAPMAGVSPPALAIAVAEAGGLGSLPCTLLAPDQMRAAFATIRAATAKPINANFFCYTPTADPAREAAWRARFAPNYAALGLDPGLRPSAPAIPPFGAVHCDLIEELKPEIVSFHCGLPEETFIDRIKACGSKIISSATTVMEASWLEERGCDAIIAQGSESGGHRAMFLSGDVSMQVGLMALLPQIADAVEVPVIGAGGIADGRGIAAAFALGAAAVQIGTAYLFSPEADVAPLYRQALAETEPDQTVISNVFTGHPARIIANRTVRAVGPMAADAPPFPLAGSTLAPLRQAAESRGSVDYTPLWSGQAAGLGRALPAGVLTKDLAEAALARLRQLQG